MTVGIIYKPPDQSKFFETFPDSLNTMNVLNDGWYILRDMNNEYGNGIIFREENKNIIKRINEISSELKKYLEFGKTFGLKQIIKRSTRVNITRPIYRSHTNKYQ